jgi:hypothetical protein
MCSLAIIADAEAAFTRASDMVQHGSHACWRAKQRRRESVARAKARSLVDVQRTSGGSTPDRTDLGLLEVSTSEAA